MAGGDFRLARPRGHKEEAPYPLPMMVPWKPHAYLGLYTLVVNLEEAHIRRLPCLHLYPELMEAGLEAADILEPSEACYWTGGDPEGLHWLLGMDCWKPDSHAEHWVQECARHAVGGHVVLVNDLRFQTEFVGSLVAEERCRVHLSRPSQVPRKLSAKSLRFEDFCACSIQRRMGWSVTVRAWVLSREVEKYRSFRCAGRRQRKNQASDGNNVFAPCTLGFLECWDLGSCDDGLGSKSPLTGKASPHHPGLCEVTWDLWLHVVGIVKARRRSRGLDFRS